MFGGSKRKKNKEGNKFFAETFHWAWSHSILQIKGNQATYQIKAYVMVGTRMEDITKG
jgi:hypothetical protein